MTKLCTAVVVVALSCSANVLALADDILSADRSISDVVDFYIDRGLARESVRAAVQADDAALCRRLTLDLAGRIPTAAESRAYVESTDSDKRTKLVERLMASPGFIRHQAAELDALLAGGGKGSLREYLLKAVGENRAWDRIFRELLLPDQTDSLQKIAAEYLRQRVKDPDRLTVDVSSTFFGINISCAQCHDHPLVHDWKQDHFFGMKSFLARTFVNGSENKGFVGEHGHGTIKFKTTDDVEKQARLMFLTGRRIDEPEAREPTRDEQKTEKAALEKAKKENVPPPAPKFSARAKLVEVALAPADREFFARAIVNRVWYRLFGQGLVMPLDQMHSANPPSHPELLAWLARDMATHGYDLRRLIKGLVMSRAYARDSRWEGGESPRASLFAVALVRPLASWQLATSLELAVVDPASLPADFRTEPFEKAITSIDAKGRGLAAAMASATADAQIGVSEALFFSNGKRVAQELLADGTGRLVGRLRQAGTPAGAVELAVRNTLSRAADQDELRVLGDYISQRTDRPEDAYQQLLWALLASSEFRFNH